MMKPFWYFILISVGLMVATASAGIINSTTSLYIPMNGTAGTTTFSDLSPSAHPVYNMGTASIQNANDTWRFNNAAYFGGNASSIINIPSANLSAYWPWSISMWVNTSSATGQVCYIGTRNRTGRGSGEFCFGSLGAGDVWIDVYDSSEFGSDDSSTFNDGKWHFWNFQRTNATYVQAWVDGTLKLSRTISATDNIGSTTRNLSLGQNAVDSRYFTGYIDDVVIYNATLNGTIRTTEFASSSSAPEFPISANFTQSVNPSTVGQAVSFTDTSNGTVVTRNWTFFYSSGSFNDRNASPTYTWSTSGTYNVWLNVTNTTGAASSMSQSHTVNNASVLYPQDIWMEGVFAQTFFVHNSDGVGIGNVSINAGNYSTVTSSTGYATLSTPFGSYLTTFTATGYTTRQISYVFDSDATHDVELTGVVVPVTPSQSTWWTPHQVQVVILDTFGQPLDMVNITAAFNQSSMPESWLNDLYGLNTNISTQMVNRSLYLHGDTGSDGEITFPMLGTIKYDIWVTSLPDGVDNYHVQAYPSDDYLNIYVPTTGSQLPTQGNSTYMFLNQSRVYFTEPDINNVSMCVDYQDTSGSTTSLTVNWTFVNNHTVVNTSTFNPGTSLNTLCYTLRNVRGTQVWWYYNATRSVA